MINVTRSSMPAFEEYIEEIRELWDTHWLTNMGSKHRQLQEKLELFLDCPHVTLYTNGHLALENAIAALNLPKGGEVITTPFTFASTIHAIALNGLIPVFCDVNSDDYTIDVGRIPELITDRTVAIVPVHVYGNMCDVESIEAIAGANHLKVVYDAAHAFAVTYKNKSSACFGDMSMFSFHATKVFNTIEGGAVCYANSNFIQTLDDLKNFGIRNQEDVACIGGNAKMNEFQAAMGLCNLRCLDREMGKRKMVYEKYVELLSGIPGIILCRPQADVTPNYAYFPVVFDGYKYNRDKVYDLLKANDIAARKYFYPLINACTCYKDLPTAGPEKTPIATHVADRVLTLPMYADLAHFDVERICDIIRS